MSERDSGLAVDDEQILTVFVESDQSPLYAWEVAQNLPVDAPTLDEQLDDLEERGLLESDDDFGTGTVWRVPDDADLDDALDRDATDETNTEGQATGTSTGTMPRDQETAETPPPEAGEETAWREYEPPTDPIASFDPPGTPEQKGQRREALRHAYAYVREHGPADREELVERVYPDYPGAFDAPDAGWWDEVIVPGFEELDDVERTDGGEWAVAAGETGTESPGETA